ncbi:hypothetical protein ANCCAN_12344, partial [Ancylostoma caninum]
MVFFQSLLFQVALLPSRPLEAPIWQTLYPFLSKTVPWGPGSLPTAKIRIRTLQVEADSKYPEEGEITDVMEEEVRLFSILG